MKAMAETIGVTPSRISGVLAKYPELRSWFDLTPTFTKKTPLNQETLMDTFTRNLVDRFKSFSSVAHYTAQIEATPPGLRLSVQKLIDHWAKGVELPAANDPTFTVTDRGTVAQSQIAARMYIEAIGE
jgi:hypothetical protein